MVEIVIKTLDEGYDEYNDQLDQLRRDFGNSKTFLCCIPGGVGSEADAARDRKKCPELKKVCGLAITKETNKVVGVCQVLFEGMPNIFHKCEEGEACVLILAVDPNCYGMGIGTQLMVWAEALARERECTFMALDVFHNNPSIRLYKRQGYVIQPRKLWKKLLCAIPFACLMGPIVCPTNAPNYCSYSHFYNMRKELE